tara:strand:+ start:442 stop:693 length:252 start_codon:yes stop_codon:yes gene_type:complete
MILIIDNTELASEISFNMREGDIIQDLIDSFIESYSADLFDKSELLLVRQGDFFFIIKNIYGNLTGSVLLSSLPEIINNHLNI